MQAQTQSNGDQTCLGKVLLFPKQEKTCSIMTISMAFISYYVVCNQEWCDMCHGHKGPEHPQIAGATGVPNQRAPCCPPSPVQHVPPFHLPNPGIWTAPFPPWLHSVGSIPPDDAKGIANKLVCKPPHDGHPVLVDLGRHHNAAYTEAGFTHP